MLTTPMDFSISNVNKTEGFCSKLSMQGLRVSHFTLFLHILCIFFNQFSRNARFGAFFRMYCFCWCIIFVIYLFFNIFWTNLHILHFFDVLKFLADIFLKRPYNSCKFGAFFCIGSFFSFVIFVLSLSNLECFCAFFFKNVFCEFFPHKCIFLPILRIFFCHLTIGKYTIIYIHKYVYIRKYNKR